MQEVIASTTLKDVVTLVAGQGICTGRTAQVVANIGSIDVSGPRDGGFV
jgi:hypothetical protein